MKNNLIIVFLFLFVSNQCFSQRTKEKDDDEKYSSVYIATSLNYYQPIEPFKYFKIAERSGISLEYITSTSGTFTIDEEAEEVNIVTTIGVPSQLINIGASIQIRNSYSIFHEFSLSRFSIADSYFCFEYEIPLANKTLLPVKIGYLQRSTFFSIKYEFGKYFGHPRKSKVRFGVSGSIEPSLFSFNRNSYATNEFPVEGGVFSLHFALNPMISFKLGKKTTLEFKTSLSILIADAGTIKYRDAGVIPTDQLGQRDTTFPNFSLAGSLQLRYQIKEADNRSRRR